MLKGLKIKRRVLSILCFCSRITFCVVAMVAFLQPVYSQGWKKDIQVGDALMSQRRYAEALELYNEALYKNPEVKVSNQLVECYEVLEDWRKLATWTHKSYRENPSPEGLLKTAQAFKKVGDYERAKVLYRKYLTHSDDAEQAKIEMAGCDSALKWREDYMGPEPRNYRSINTAWSETAPVVYDDQLVFVSNREGTLIRSKNSMNNLPYFDLYAYPFISPKRKKKVAYFDSFLASRSHFGPVAFAPDGKTMYFTKSKSPKDNDGPSSRPKLYMTTNENGKWQDPLKFVMNDSAFVFGHPSISEDGKIFLFSSNMPGGFGGLDIYFCIRIDSTWSDPINLGTEVNTAGNEISPFLKGKSKLYFASDSHVGMGGFDMFTSVLQDDGQFSEVQNCGPRLNSSYDELSLFENDSYVFFASNRAGGEGKEDIYYLKK